MNYESFKETILNRLSEDFPEPKHIISQKVHRNNGTYSDGLVILEDGANVSPTLYLDQYYKTYLNGDDFSSVYRQIIECYEKNKTSQRIDAAFFTDFDRIRARIVIKLIHYEKNMELLRDLVPHIRFLDLAIVFYSVFPVDPDIGNATILIDRSHLALWDITADELYPIAMENTVRLLEPKLNNINDMLQEMLDMPGYPCVPVPDDPLFPMYVLTNEPNMFGAACMAYDGLIRSYADRFRSDFYILPSSIHEVILIPSYKQDRMDEFSKMVREVNRTQVAPEDILSDHAYYYSREKDQILY